MKPDEARLLKHLAAAMPEDTTEWHGEEAYNAAAAMGIPRKRVEYFLEKWAQRFWWEYGVSIRLGWMTKEGRAAAATLPAGEGG